MNLLSGFLKYLGPILTAVLTNAVTIRLGAYQATATVAGGTPVHFTWAAAVLAATKVAAGLTGTFASGDITVTVGPYLSVAQAVDQAAATAATAPAYPDVPASSAVPNEAG